MSSFYQKFLRKQIDLAPLGVEQSSDHTTYFCTPKGASIIGWAGVDAIHYCFVRGFGEMVFAVSPANTNPDYVHPLANSFEDFLRLLLACGSADALEQAWKWNKEQFDTYIKENTPIENGQLVLSEMTDKRSLSPIENPWQYIKELQNTFDYSKIKYTEDFYDPDMNGNIERTPPKWEVYFDGNLWGHRGKGRAGTEFPISKEFDWAGHLWWIPSAYSCAQGLVVDFCMAVDPKLISGFMKKWNFIDKNGEPHHFTQDERRRMEYENPTKLDFCASLTLNGKEIKSRHGCGVGYNPLDTDIGNDLEGQWAVKHYGLDQKSGWMIWRCAFPWSTKHAPKIKSLSVTMEQDHVAVPGTRFNTNAPGDTVEFIHPQTGEHHVLTVMEYEQKEMLKDCFRNEDMNFPNHYHAMNYTLTPPLPDCEMSVSDCLDSDQPRKKEPLKSVGGLREKYQLLPSARNDAVVIGVIGGSNGTTVHGNRAKGEVRGTCSSLHFEPVEDVEW